VDYNKIGLFIERERKAKKLTQAKLAKEIFVSEKTISKWENGRGIPDTNSLSKLCDIFDVTINELLNGERISKENYESKAEAKILELQKAKEKSDRRLLVSEVVFGSIITIFFLSVVLASAYAIKSLNIIVVPVIVLCISVILFIFGLTFCLVIEQKAGYYLCEKCNHKHVPKFSQVLFAMHINRTRYMKCPHCKKRSWQKKVIK